MEEIKIQDIRSPRNLCDFLNGFAKDIEDINSLLKSLRKERAKEDAETRRREEALAEKEAKIDAKAKRLAEAKALIAQVKAKEITAAEAKARAKAEAEIIAEAVAKAKELVAKSKS